MEESTGRKPKVLTQDESWVPNTSKVTTKPKGPPTQLREPQDGIDIFHPYSSDLHTVVMSYKDNLDSPKLSEILLSINGKQFHELKEESVSLVLPLIIKSLQTEASDFAFVFLYEASIKFPKVFEQAELQPLLLQCIDAIENAPTNAFEPVLENDIYKLREFLLSCFTKTHPNKKPYVNLD